MTARILARITAEPWLIQSEALDSILQIAARDLPDESTLAAWKHDAARHALATRPGDRLGNAPTARVRDGIAIVPVAGPIFRYANIFTAFSGATALADLAENMAVAMADSRVRGILLEIDSPGGEVTGLAEAAALVAQAATIKPTAAYVEGSAMSAAYWLASAAGEIAIASTGSVGSLGAIVAMLDTREAEAKSGVRRYRFVSSQTPNKLPDPTTEGGAARLQAHADRIATEFLAEAAANRGMSVDALLAATDGGGWLIGADAVAEGLADRVAGFEATLARLAAGEVALRTEVPHPPGPAPRATIQEPAMTTKADAPAPAPETTATTPAPAPAPETTATQAPAAPAAPPADSSAPRAALPATDPIAAERARCAAITAAAKPGFGKLSAMAIANGWPLDQFTQAQDASAEAVENARTEAAGTSFRATLNPPVAGTGEADPAPQTVEEKAKAEWAGSEAIRREFGTEGALVAYRRAEADGKVRPLRKSA